MIKRILYFLRNLAYRDMFKVINENASGDILDIGGGEFYKDFLKLKIPFKTYTIAEKRKISIPDHMREQIIFREIDNEKLEFPDNSFDTVLCIHMLEHTLNPESIISEIHRVLKKEGRAIILVPQTSIPHDIPEHYYNFTQYFIRKVLEKYGFKISKLEMLGGSFFTIASHLFHLPLYIFNHPLYRDKSITRGISFYLLLPLKLLLIPILFFIAILLSVADIKEVANNILLVAEKE